MIYLRIFLPFGFGYLLSYLFRTVNAVIAPDLVRDLGLDPASLGLLTSAYFLAFATLQLPVGLLLDRYGPRRVEAGLLLLAATGALMFSRAEGLGELLLARALIGAGVAACLMAAFKAFALWFSAERLALANGVQMVSGGIGALLATAPVEFALRFTDWRGVFLAVSGIDPPLPYRAGSDHQRRAPRARDRHRSRLSHGRRPSDPADSRQRRRHSGATAARRGSGFAHHAPSRDDHRRRVDPGACRGRRNTRDRKLHGPRATSVAAI
jgi:MFS family permease